MKNILLALIVYGLFGCSNDDNSEVCADIVETYTGFFSNPDITTTQLENLIVEYRARLNEGGCEFVDIIPTQ